MTNTEIKKSLVNNWFDYLQLQICGEFENLENSLNGKSKRFGKRVWKKKDLNEGGGASYLLSNGKLFDKVGVNKSTVSGVFKKEFRSNILGAQKDGKDWASGASVVAHTTAYDFAQEIGTGTDRIVRTTVSLETLTPLMPKYVSDEIVSKKVNSIKKVDVAFSETAVIK